MAQVLPDARAPDRAGFVPIFDGRTLKGWDGDPLLWRADNGTIVGETRAPNLAKYDSFLIWRGGEPADFELKLEYRVSASGNSSINYRSVQLPDQRWAMSGGGFDIDGAMWGKKFYEAFAKPRGFQVPRVTGQNFESHGRGFLALPGQITWVGPGQRRRVVGAIGEAGSAQKAIREDWNEVHLIIRGNQMIHILNRQVVSIVTDDDATHRRLKGLIGLELDHGLEMKVEFRNIALKQRAPICKECERQR